MIEFLEDVIEHDPHEAFPREVQESGKYIVKTGDRQMDEWQRKAALGEKIDFMEAFASKDQKDLFAKILESSKKPLPEPKADDPALNEMEEFKDRYNDG